MGSKFIIETVPNFVQTSVVVKNRSTPMEVYLMARKNRTPEENERRTKIRELLQSSNISSMDDIQDLFKGTIAEFMENGLSGRGAGRRAGLQQV